MKRPIEFNGIEAFSFVTKWIDGDSLEELKEKVNPLKIPFMALISNINPDYKGLRVRYYELDGDDFGMDGDIDEVSKWLVEFIPLTEEKFEEIIEG